MLKHNVSLWRDWKMFHQEVTLLATPRINQARKLPVCPSSDKVQWNFNDSNTDGSFTMAVSNTLFESLGYCSGPSCQSIISLTSSLVFKMLTVLVSTISNSQVFLLKKKMWVDFHIFSAKILAYMPYLIIKILTTNDIVSSEQLGPYRSRKQIFKDILRRYFISWWKFMLCVLIRIVSSRQFYCIHSTYHYFIEDRKDIPKLSPFASWSEAMINP